MKIKTLILAFTLLTVASPVLAMERESNYANNNQPSELINLPDEIWGDISQYLLNQEKKPLGQEKEAHSSAPQGEEVFSRAYLKFLENLALTNRKFAALLKKDVVVNGIVHILAKKISKPQQLLHSFAKNYTGSQFASSILLAALKKAGAEINYENDKGITPLIQAIKREPWGFKQSLLEEIKINIIKYLVAAGADINKPSQKDKGCRPLMYAIADFRELNVPKLLLELGADPTLEDNDGVDALGYATQYPVKRLLKKAQKRLMIKRAVKEAVLELLSSSELKEILRKMKNKENNNNS